MLAGIRGTLISHFFAEEILATAFAGQLGEATRGAGHAAFVELWRSLERTTGPASGVRTLWDCGAVPVLRLLGHELGEPRPIVSGALTARGRSADATLDCFLVPWGEELGAAWRILARQDVIQGRWCLCFNGTTVRVVDATRVHADRYIEFDLESAATDERSFSVFWAALRAVAFKVDRVEGSLFERLVAASRTHATGVCGSLQHGVLEALSELLTGLAAPARSRRPRRPPSREALSAALNGSLTVVYRVLFLLFAEARGLVPTWHPIYRAGYTIEALRTVIEQRRPPRGLWETLQAIARLAREGCSAGDLRVTPFNGRLFAPLASVDSSRAVGEDVVRRALLALSTTAPGHGGRQRIDYRDLGVEQLGAVYERVLDHRPSWEPELNPSVRMRTGSPERKATGSFYTPKSITEYLVRRTLHPLVRQATSDGILALRVLDPAMGSAAFLVAACHYLAHAYETALIREGSCGAHDVSDSDRRGFRRRIAQRCLFGVDRNHMAVQLARLSIWLATLAGDRPLTFLDHHLRTGDSLIGATPADLARRTPPRTDSSRIRRRPASLPFFEDQMLEDDLKSVLPDRRRIAEEPGDTLTAVQEKERLLERLVSRNGVLERWRMVADLWCGCWFWPDAAPPTPQTFGALADELLHRPSVLPRPTADRLLRTARDTAAGERFFHWVLEFPEAFYDPDGRPLPHPGFDAVIGNPPWSMLRGEAGDPDARRAMSRRTRFIKDSGVYRAQSAGHVNLYQTFTERAVQLTRRGGRIGIVLPSGLLTDEGAGPLRNLLLRRCQTDSLALLENRDGVFPIHRSVKFALLTSTKDGATDEVRCHMGIRDPAVLDTIDDSSSVSFRVRLGTPFIERVSGAGLALPDIRADWEASLLERLSRRFKPLAARDGWNLAFGRELNATEDARRFTRGRRGLPVLEGKQIGPFRVDLDGCRLRITEGRLPRRLAGSGDYRRARLAYREVASASNRLTLIAALVPAHVVTTHSIFCLKTPLSELDQAFLCGVLNSFVANFLVRLFVTTHVTAGVIGRLLVPGPGTGSLHLREIAGLATRLAEPRETWAGDYARLQARVARAYECDEAEFVNVLGTFPLVHQQEREAALACFREDYTGAHWS